MSHDDLADLDPTILWSDTTSGRSCCGTAGGRHRATEQLSESGVTSASLSGYKMRMFDTAGCCGHDRPMTERVEAAVRMAVVPGTTAYSDGARSVQCHPLHH